MDALHLSLRQLQVFVAVARLGSTAAASAEVALSQSATSAALNSLEHGLGVALFDRVGKGLQLNDNGLAMLPRAQNVLDGALAIERLAQDGEAQMLSLRLGCSSTLGNNLLPGLLAQALAQPLGDAQSTWAFRAQVANTAEICQAVAHHDLDLGLVEGPCHLPDLEATPWRRDDLVLVGAAKLPASRRWSVAQLQQQVWLLREPGSGTRETTDQLLLPHLQGYRRSLELGSSEALQRAAALGLGVACLSGWAVEEAVKAGRLRVLRTELPALSRQCYRVMRRDKLLTVALQRFIALLDQP
jgi:DNA-binding transcriptional LysR family regulator